MPDHTLLNIKKDRETWIDYARGIAIILVLYRHVFEGLSRGGVDVQHYLSLERFNIMFFSFRMPLFFIISGFFVTRSLNKRGIEDFVRTKSRTILYPYFLWGAMQITLQLLFSRYVNTPPTVKSYLYLFYLPREIEQFWYLYALFNVSVLYALVKVKLKLGAIQNLGLGVLLYALSIIFHQKNIHMGFLVDILHYYMFYAIGDVVSRLIQDKKNLKYLASWKVLLILLFPFIAAQVYFLLENEQSGSIFEDRKLIYEYVEFYEPVRFILVALIGCAFVINISFVLQKYGRLKWLHRLGSHSLYIYVAHVIVLAGTRVFMTKVLHIYYFPVLLVSGILMGLLVPVIIYQVANKLNMYWLFSLEKKETTLPVKTETNENKI